MRLCIGGLNDKIFENLKALSARQLRTSYLQGVPNTQEELPCILRVDNTGAEVPIRVPTLLKMGRVGAVASVPISAAWFAS